MPEVRITSSFFLIWFRSASRCFFSFCIGRNRMRYITTAIATKGKKLHAISPSPCCWPPAAPVPAWVGCANPKHNMLSIKDNLNRVPPPGEAPVARRQHAIEHIHPAAHGLQDVLRPADAHQIARLVRRQPCRRRSERGDHLRCRLADAEAAERVARKGQRRQRVRTPRP